MVAGTPENMVPNEVIRTRRLETQITATDDKIHHTLFVHLTETVSETASDVSAGGARPSKHGGACDHGRHHQTLCGC